MYVVQLDFLSWYCRYCDNRRTLMQFLGYDMCICLSAMGHDAWNKVIGLDWIGYDLSIHDERCRKRFASRLLCFVGGVYIFLLISPAISALTDVQVNTTTFTLSRDDCVIINRLEIRSKPAKRTSDLRTHLVQWESIHPRTWGIYQRLEDGTLHSRLHHILSNNTHWQS